MIHLTSTPTPAATARLLECAQTLEEARQAGIEVPNGILHCYRSAAVKESIVAETKGKCAYCESLVTVVYFGDVEHIAPKKKFPDLMLSYGNLTLACAICNNRKGDYFSLDAPILNPYVDVPEEHLIGGGFWLWRRNGSAVGQRTIDLLELNTRKGLFDRRREKLERIRDLAERYLAEPPGPVKKILGEQIREEVSGEYALVSRSYVRHVHDIQWDTL